MPAPKGKTSSLYARNIPVAVKAQFKAYCARHDYTMEAVIIAFMRRAIKDDTILPEARKGR